jgi:hypothetical protein
MGALEEALAARVALCLWRLDRVARYETAVTAVRLEETCEEIRSAESPPAPFGDEAKKPAARLQKALEALEKKRETVDVWEGLAELLEQLPQTPDGVKMSADDVFAIFQDLCIEVEQKGGYLEPEDTEFLAALGVPRDELDIAYEWEGWTASMVKRGLARMAVAAELPPEKLLARAVKRRQADQDKGKAEVRELERQVKLLAEKPAGEVNHMVVATWGWGKRTGLEIAIAEEDKKALPRGKPMSPRAVLKDVLHLEKPTVDTPVVIATPDEIKKLHIISPLNTETEVMVDDLQFLDMDTPGLGFQGGWQWFEGSQPWKNYQGEGVKRSIRWGR